MTSPLTPCPQKIEGARHTSGPWTVMEQSWSNTAVVAGDDCICALDINHATEETQEALEAVMAANARLIAAAPDLLEAAQEALAELYRVSPSFAAPKLRAAIAKATASPL